MDLIGITSSSENFVEVYRCGTKLQKVFQREDVSSPTSFEFAENGKLCVVGYKDGRVCIIKVDSAQLLFQFVGSSCQFPILWKTSKFVDEPLLNNLSESLASLETIDDKMSAQVKDMRKMAKDIFQDRKLKKSMVFSGGNQGEIMVAYCGLL